MALRAGQRWHRGSAARSSSSARVNLEPGEREVEAERNPCCQLPARSCSPGSTVAFTWPAA